MIRREDIHKAINEMDISLKQEALADIRKNQDTIDPDWFERAMNFVSRHKKLPRKSREGTGVRELFKMYIGLRKKLAQKYSEEEIDEILDYYDRPSNSDIY